MSLNRRLLRDFPFVVTVSVGVLGCSELSAQSLPEGARASMFPAQATVKGDRDLPAGVTIVLPGLILLSPASTVALPIEVTPADIGARGVLLRLRGLPEALGLSEGHVIAPGSWAVPIAALPRLRVSVPHGLSGKSDLSVTLVTIDGSVLAEAKSVLLIAAAGLIAPSQPGVAASSDKEKSVVEREVSPKEKITPETRVAPVLIAPQSDVAANRAVNPPATPPARAAGAENAKPLMDEASRQKVVVMLGRARALMQDGNIVAARLFFERAADEGSADAALALGGTFDPIELGRILAHGLKPDPVQARRWYEKAVALGNSEAADRLKRLGSR